MVLSTKQDVLERVEEIANGLLGPAYRSSMPCTEFGAEVLYYGLKREVEALTEEQTEMLAQFLEDEGPRLADLPPPAGALALTSLLFIWKEDPVLRGAMSAPYDDEPLTEGERVAIEEALEDVRQGNLVSDEEIRREFRL